MLAELAQDLRATLGILHKQDIQTAANAIGRTVSSTEGYPIRLGDDCAAIPDGNGFVLLAAEGMLPQLVERSPWFAGWCAVMVNISDIAAMGGEPTAVVDALWSRSVEESGPLWEGMTAAVKAYGVPIVGGHTNCHSPYAGLSVAILGRAKRLISSFDAQPGDALIMVMDMAGEYFQDYSFWNAATMAEPEKLRSQLKRLPQLSEAGLVSAGKDISMGGIAGTLLMLAEASQCGAILNIDKIPRPPNTAWKKWLTSFPSFGFLFSVPPQNVIAVKEIFLTDSLTCEVIGEITNGRDVLLSQQHAPQTAPQTVSQTSSQIGSQIGQPVQAKLWDLSQPLTGFSAVV